LEITKQQLLTAMEQGKRLDGPTFANFHAENAPNNDPSPWLLSFIPPFQSSSLETKSPSDMLGKISLSDFEAKAKQTVSRAGYGWASSDLSWPRLRKSVLYEALAEASDRITNHALQARNPTYLLQMRRGLQLYGIEIVPDNESDVGSLDISNGLLPFSLRLICCVIRMPLALSNLKLVTLDLSGSALVGVDACFLRAEGSVRLRMGYSSAPLDFSGAEIHGFFDGCDSLFHPFGPLPVGQSVNGDRGVLNLSQARIGNELRLKRAAILGGFSMRGLDIQRSIFLDDAVLMSPLATLEQMVVPPEPKPAANHKHRSIQDLILNASQHVRVTRSDKVNRLNAIFPEAPNRLSCFHILMTESMRIRTSALRGDGVKVGGSIFASGLRCEGRLRLKYAFVAGGLSLQGAGIRSAEAQLSTFVKAEYDVASLSPTITGLCDYRANTYNELIKRNRTTNEERNVDDLAAGADDYALDLREGHFGGSIRIGFPLDALPNIKPEKTKIDGVIALERADINGDLILNWISFSWTCRLKRHHRFEKEDQANPHSGVKTLSSCKAIQKRNAERDMQVKEGRRYSILATSLKMTGHFAVLQTTGLNGIDLSNAQIGGDFALFEKIIRKNKDQLLITYTSRTVKGRVKLAGAAIGGDCKLLFSNKKGPHIKAERVVVAGAIAIAPQSDDCQSEDSDFVCSMTPPDYKMQVKKIESDKKAANQRAAKNQDQEQPNSPHNFLIDLGNARSTFLHHPPPAWPRAGSLLITGFQYQRGFEFGPLAPHPFKTNKNESTIWLQIKDEPFTFVFSALFLCAALCALAICIVGGAFLKTHNIGHFETCILAAFLSIAWLYRFAARHTRPNKVKTRPMAIDWLDLQVMSKNAYRRDQKFSSELMSFVHSLTQWPRDFKPVGHTYHSLEPYSVAVKALRESGRWISANLVEARRLKVRDQQLSCRGNFIQKLLYATLDFVNRYGFSLSRPLFLVGILICIGALLASQAEKMGAITPKAEAHLSSALASNFSKCRVACNETQEGFVPLLYAIDQVVPIAGLKQDESWELNNTAFPFSTASNWSFATIFAILHISGLSVAGLLLLAFSTRLGLVFQRYSD
jgi:hypothetical protein